MLEFYRGKNIFITGHTGFKGTWLSKILIDAGAKVTGYALEPNTNPSLFEMINMSGKMKSVIGDIRDYERLVNSFEMAQPEIVFHLAAQPIVRCGYTDPRYTYEINVMGTVNILECIKNTHSVKSVLNVTTDKVYKNNEWCWGYREDEQLDGFDPYSNSKSCSELVTHCYNNCFFYNRNIAVSTARAGNVLGGGDFAKDRIIPDCVRSIMKNEAIAVRNPNSIRPYQHVLEPLALYLKIAEMQYEDKEKQGYYNVGPDDCDCISTGELVDLFCKKWGNDASWMSVAEDNAPHEAEYLKLDCSKAKKEIGWKPRWHIDKCIEKVCDFNKIWFEGGSLDEEMNQEIEEFFGGA